jgi:hypothetical protein
MLLRVQVNAVLGAAWCGFGCSLMRSGEQVDAALRSRSLLWPPIFSQAASGPVSRLHPPSLHPPSLHLHPSPSLAASPRLTSRIAPRTPSPASHLPLPHTTSTSISSTSTSSNSSSLLHLFPTNYGHPECRATWLEAELVLGRPLTGLTMGLEKTMTRRRTCRINREINTRRCAAFRRRTNSRKMRPFESLVRVSLSRKFRHECVG